jgi:glyoxylase I family protein
MGHRSPGASDRRARILSGRFTAGVGNGKGIRFMSSASPLGLRGLHHVSLVVKRLEPSRAFYCDVLGFREIPRPAFSFGGAWLYNFGLQVHLIVDEQRAEPEGGIQTRDDHLAFETLDLEAAERHLQGHNIVYRVNFQAGTNVKQLFFRDPDGHHIEVAHYGPTQETPAGQQLR